MKPTEYIAKSASTTKTGLFATLHGRGDATVSGAPVLGRVAILFVTTCALLALWVGVAGAAVSRLVLNGSFHAAGASGIAVDQSSGDVFTSGFVSFGEEGPQVGRSEEFDAAGKVLSPPSPFNEGLDYGTALNPTNGHLYVTSASGEIEVYDSSTGVLLSSFAVPVFGVGDEAFANNVQIATNSAGDVYVPNVPENKVLEYNETGTLLASFTGSGAHALKGPTGVAVDASGDVWVADNGHNRIEELAPTGAFLSEFESEGVRALALDAQGDVVAIVDNSVDRCNAIKPPCEHLVEYSQSGAQLADIGAGYFGAPNDELGGERLKESMVAVDDATGRVYVSDGLHNVVWIAEPPSAPALGRESVAEVGTSEAKLGVLVRPGGIQTTYRFEYDTREYHEGEGSHGVSVPFPEGSAGEGFASRVVWGSAKDLIPGTTYHYRAVATNALGSVAGPDRTLTTETVAQAACPNEPARGGFSADLPECRAYELVTPPSNSSAQADTKTSATTEEENGDFFEGGLANNLAAGDGDRFTYESSEVMPGSQSAGLEFLATRGPNGWSSQDLYPLRPYTGSRCPFYESTQTAVLQFSPELSNAIIEDNKSIGGNTRAFYEECRGETVEVVSGEPFEQNLLASNTENGLYQLVNLTPAGVAPEPASLIAASADLNLVVFSERAKLTPDAPSGVANQYEWREGAVRLLKLESPSGASVVGSVVNVSPDGSDLFFTANGSLYVRIDGERTVQLDQAQGGSGPGGGGTLAAVSSNGSQVFFTDDAAAGLTSDTVAGSGKNLYRYDVSTGQLTDLTPTNDANAQFKGISEDGSYVYFSSEGAQSGAQTNQLGETAQNGQANLYVEHDGTLTFVINATLMTPPHSGGKAYSISQSGAFVAFNAIQSLTGYENDGDYEIYLYSAAANHFECASCNPSGEAPTASGAVVGIPHAVSDSGQIFFETDEALSPRDTNGQWDAYEFDYDGGLHLISTGTSSGPSIVLDASVSGNDVFFLTPQSLVPQDNSQEAYKIYDARVDGGFPVTASPPACTTAEACRSAASPQPGIFGAPPSQTFSGAGNLVPSAVAAVKPQALKRGQKLTRALKTCHRERRGRKRLTCERQAKQRYGTKASRSQRSGKANTSRRGGK